MVEASAVPFATLPFHAQRERVRAAAEGEGWRELMREAARLPDAEPLGCLLDELAARARLGPEVLSALIEAFDVLVDPALAHLLERPSMPEVELTLVDAVEATIGRFPLERASAHALFARWLRRRAPERYQRVVAHAESELASDDPRRWLYVRGPRLAELATKPEHAVEIREAVDVVLDALARAPKSISQANAERLLASAVYADPGHFLFELIQNADDAGATTFRVRFESERVVVVNDGAPFSFLDLVGLLSIGQTTKRVDQIGFFGVGFKSVYEVCERPRVHSGPFDVELAHVSIPRRVSSRPSDCAPHETALVLPLSPHVEPQSLRRRALEIPPETLMTLPHLRALEVDADHAWREEQDGDERVLIHLAGERRRYRTARGEVRFEGERPAGRSSESEVIVAASVDPDGHLCSTEGPTLFAFLPTGQRTGLGVRVHARFDVTLDRERLELDSAWNEALLAEAGRSLATLIARESASGRAALGVLRPGRRLDPVVGRLWSAARDALRSVPCVPAEDGFVLPDRARLTTPDLARSLAGVDLGEGARAVAFEGDTAETVEELGGSVWTGVEQVSFCRKNVRAEAEAPPWLDRPMWLALASAEVPDAELRALPLVPTASGLFPSEDAHLAAPTWARLYAGLAPVVDQDALLAWPDRLRARLALPAFDPMRLVEDLEGALAKELRAREEALLAALSTAPEEVLSALRSSRVFSGDDGVATSVEDGLCWLDPSLDALRGELSELGVRSVPPRLSQHAFLRRWLPRFGLSELAAHLDGVVIADELAERLLTILRQQAEQLPVSVARRFGRYPIFPCADGIRRPLLGTGRGLVPADADLVQQLPAWPWCTERGALIQAVGPRPFGVPELAGELCDGRRAADLAASRVLLRYASRLSARRADALVEAPVWLSVDEKPLRLSSLRPGGGGPALDALYDDGLRVVAAPIVAQLLRALRRSASFADSDHQAFLADLMEQRFEPSARALVLDALLESARALSPAAVSVALEAPIYPDESGELRRLASWSATSDDACHRAGALRTVLRGAGLPLLAAEEEARLSDFLDVIGLLPASPVDLIRHAGLIDDPERVLAALLPLAAELDEGARSALAELRLFETRSGRHVTASELCDPAPFEAVFPSALDRLGLDDRLGTVDAIRAARALELATYAPGRVVETKLWPALTLGAPLSEQPSFAQSRDALHRLARLALALGLSLDGAPVALDASGRLVSAPALQVSESLRSLLADLPIAARLADAEWARGSVDPAAMLEPLDVGRVAEALRQAYPEERQPDGRAEALFAWLREAADELASRPEALAALGGAAILPSQRRTLRAARNLVLDPTLPDLGLRWGLAPSVPPDLARWLAERFELERAARLALVSHVLDGLDEAREAADRPRAGELLGFLARSLGAATKSEEELSQRVRRTKVRARLQVPLVGGGWEKPRFAWAPSDDLAAGVSSFALAVPPAIDLADLDEGSRRVLAACGARTDLDVDAVDALLKGEGRVEGAAADRALARYALRRALEAPRLVERWRLRERAWLPAREGTLRRPAELLWPDDLAVAFFGEGDERFPDPEVIRGLPVSTAVRLGIPRAETLSLAEIAARAEGFIARPALLDWLDEGLKARRFTSAEVRAALRDRLWLVDEEGRARPARELAVDGARLLFGEWRGDLGPAATRPRVERALGIPTRPDAQQILAYLRQMGRELSTLDTRAKASLAVHLPRCTERLHEVAADARLGPEMALAAISSTGVEIVLADDPRLRVHVPGELAAQLPSDAVWLDPLPSAEGEDELASLFLHSGMRDLWSELEVEEVEPGPSAPAAQPAADELHRELSSRLAVELGSRARAVEGLILVGSIRAGPATDRFSERVRVGTEAAVYGDTLFLTPSAVDEPARIAVALAPADPQRRAALAEWLGARSAKPPPRRASTSAAAIESTATESKRGWWSRITDLFASDEASDEAAPPPSRPLEINDARDERFFRPDEELRPQLDTSEGWLESRRERPRFGFAFSPTRLPAPWLYAPKMLVTRFERRLQVWSRGTEVRPRPRGEAGRVVMRGRLPAGESVLPIPVYGRVLEVRASRGEVSVVTDDSGTTFLRLAEESDLRLTYLLGDAPAFGGCVVARGASNEPFVPDDELPDEILDFVSSLDADEPPVIRALAIRDRIRERYRYDPSYLEDPSVGRWLARLTAGRANAHIAALHAASDGRHLGAGVCYELNTLACELLRRAGIPSAVTVGWVFDSGHLSEPDHLWATAMLEDQRGHPVWLPIDASTTREGRPLRIPRRPPGRFRPPRDARAQTPKAPRRWDLDAGRGERRPPKTKRRRVPRAELRRLIRYLESLAKRELDADERAALEAELTDPARARALLARLLDER